MEQWLITVLTIVGSVAASSGFWTYMMSRQKKKDGTTQMLIGLAHDRIIFLGMSYVRRGWLTQDEYNNLHDYLFIPYQKLGGNGTAERVMKEVAKLPIRDSLELILEEVQEEKMNEQANIGVVPGGAH